MTMGNALRKAAEQQGTDASKVIRDMIDVYLAALKEEM